MTLSVRVELGVGPWSLLGRAEPALGQKEKVKSVFPRA